ncbi:branched-chain amino acid ABC transporter permease [Sedimenticola selenatireducens]|uniref:Branched-chain amino acid ABC transporter permease n=1 Tax=Sedimenticola selenatireducens TaxID=191960 RepID=A0A2N6CWG4_9GAMM|nr:branched-chain amino acid ABC transporter permease [Sedimenticola selenatireducens]PLX61594.1 MAG: branched-chain amino acid ABC transporter permease [Sedimenticola selenatireducens]
MTYWIDAVLQGVLVGGLYALFALGLSLMFGVMRLVNVAHGDMVILMAFIGYITTQTMGLDPFSAMVVVVPIAFVIGYALQRGVFNKTISKDPLRSLVVTFGISIIIQNLLLEYFSADSRAIVSGGIEAQSIQLTDGLAAGLLPVIILATAVILTFLLQWLFGATRIGRAFRATSDDHDAAALMGVNNAHVYAIATAIAIGILGIAGIYHGMRTTFTPTDGPAQLIYAFEAVIIGGMGSFWGTLAGGMLLGIAQSIGARWDPGWGVLIGHVMFVAVLMFKPNGFFPKTR